MYLTNKLLCGLLLGLLGAHLLNVALSALFYNKMIGPNSNYEEKRWFFDRVNVNLKSRPFQAIVLSPNSDCNVPYFNLFHFGYPKIDSLRRFCVCPKESKFEEVDVAGVGKGDAVSVDESKILYYIF